MGFVVVSQALKQEEVLQTRSLLWDDIEKTVPNLSRSDIATWEAPWRGEGGPGIKAELTQTAGEINFLKCCYKMESRLHFTFVFQLRL